MEHVAGPERTRGVAGVSLVAGVLAGVLAGPAPAAEPWRALFVIAALACAGRAAWSVPALASGAALGLAAGLLAPATDTALAAARGPTPGDVLAAAALVVLGLGRARRGRATAGSPPARGAVSTLTSIGAQVIAAAAAGAALQAFTRVAGRATAGAAEDRLVAAIAVAALVALGAALLGALLRRSGQAAANVGLLATSAAAFATLPVLAGVTSPDGFAALCARIGRAPADFGTLNVDALLFATVLGAPSLLFGAALASAGGGVRLAALLAGALAGAPLASALLDLDTTTLEAATASSGSVGVIARASLIAGCAGAAAAIVMTGPRAIRAALGVGGLALAGAAWFTPLSPIRPRAPWQRFPVAPVAVFEATTGQYALVPSGDGVPVVQRDHAPITPDASEAELERLHIADWARARAEQGLAPARVVVLGLATPSRARALAEVGVDEFDRAGVPPAIGRLLERELFADAPGPPPPGDHVSSPARIDLAFRVGARELAGRGGLLAPGLDAPHAFRIPAAHGGAPANEGWAIAGSDGLRGVWLERGGALEIVRGGAPSAIERLSTPVRERDRAALRALARRARPEPDDPLAPLQSALVRFADAQRISSPFESPDEQVECTADALEGLRDHVVGRAPGSLTRLERSLVEGAADALVAQREIPWIYAFLGPIADAHGPWPALVLALCVADEEELRPDDAAARRDSPGEPR